MLRHLHLYAAKALAIPCKQTEKRYKLTQYVSIQHPLMDFCPYQSLLVRQKIEDDQRASTFAVFRARRVANASAKARDAE